MRLDSERLGVRGWLCGAAATARLLAADLKVRIGENTVADDGEHRRECEAQDLTGGGADEGSHRADATPDARDDAHDETECEQAPAVAACEFPTSTQSVDGAFVLNADGEDDENEANREEDTGDEQQDEPDSDRDCDDDVGTDGRDERPAHSAGEQLARHGVQLGLLAGQRPRRSDVEDDTERQADDGDDTGDSSRDRQCEPELAGLLGLRREDVDEHRVDRPEEQQLIHEGQ